MHHSAAGKVVPARLSVAVSVSYLVDASSNGHFSVAGVTCHLAVGFNLPDMCWDWVSSPPRPTPNPYLGICGLERLEQSSHAESVLASLLADDQHCDRRQFHLIDLEGRTACWTGQDCGLWAGHRHQRDWSVAGNCLVDEGVLAAMEHAFLITDPRLKLGRRLMMALQAGEAAGGDHRSNLCTSAALQVSGEAAFPLLDLRVDFRDSAVAELMQVYERSQELWAQQWRDSLM